MCTFLGAMSTSYMHTVMFSKIGKQNADNIIFDRIYNSF